VVYKRKEAIKAYINPRFFSKQSRCFLKVATVSQLINDTGKLFHTSIILTVKIIQMTNVEEAPNWSCLDITVKSGFLH